ncbi:histidine kinase [soil metagenome]
MAAPPSRPSRSAPEPSGAWRLSRVEVLGILAFWTVFAVLAAGNRILDPRGPGIEGGLQTGAVVLAFVQSYVWALLTPPIFWLSRRYGVEREDWFSRVVVLALAGIGIAIAVDLAMGFFRFHLFPSPRFRRFGFSPLRSVARLWFLNELVVYFAVLAAGFARAYFQRLQARQEEAVRLQAETARLHAQLADARLQTLRMQVNPHFLFNTLHAVSALVERDPRGVRKMIARLSELLRYTLEGTSEQEVPLQQELSFLDDYLEIMRIRFQGRLQVDTEADPDVLEALVPNLILQPLVENAIEHGVARVEGIGQITIGAERSGDRLVLEVRDNGPPPADSVPPRDGVGLTNTRARLEQLYGADQRLVLEPAGEGGLIARIELPYHTAAEVRSAPEALPA